LSSGCEEGIIISPAGSGKTVMGLVITSVIGLPVLWLTHTNTLFKQTINRAENIIPFLKNGNISTIKGSKWNYDKPFTIGMVQTMIRNPEKVESISNEFGVVILDEAHHCPAKTFTDVISLLNPKYLFGLTATPNRADRLETLMYDVIGPVLIDIPINRIVDDGGIILPTVIYKEIETKKINDNNTNRLLKYLVNHKKRNNTIVSDIVQEAMNQEICIALSTRKEHCEILYTLTKLSWEKTGIATGDYSLKENEKTIQDLEEGKITVIFTTPDLLGEGFDVDILSRAFICLPFRSETRVEQLIGRAQRYHKDKKNVNIYDYVDTSIGVFKDQFFSPNKNKHCRYRVYERLGLSVVPG
jgi:superfamily II DNA or RNA helicase